MQTPSQLPVISVVISQHLEEAAFLWLLRDSAVNAPNYTLDELASLDDRVEANVDGVVIAGDAGVALCAEALEEGEPGEVFAAAAVALRTGNGKLLEQAVEVAQQSEENRRALISAAGWVDANSFQSFSALLLQSSSTLYQYMGIGGYAVQRIDPGERLTQFLVSDNPVLRARALKAAGELQRKDLLPALRNVKADDDPAVCFWAVWSGAMLGDTNARKNLRAFVAHPAFRRRALAIYLRVCSAQEAQSMIRGLASDEQTARLAFMGSGIVGDPFYIPGLIARMDVPSAARVAGEAFSMITGVDLAYDDLDLDEPLAEMGPTDDPEDENVEMDEDEDLPWPDKALVNEWWQKNQGRFQPGTRYLLGQPITAKNCQRVLREGYQLQRIAAALELALMNLDEPLFEWRAPGFRQQKLLALK